MAEKVPEISAVDALAILNEKLAGAFPFSLELVNPKDLLLLEKNARHMKAEQFEVLVENIRKDGNLSQLPFCYREEDGRLRVLSGNHRVKAAIAAGVEQTLVLVAREEKNTDERLAIQLSHNAIAGVDDLIILKQLWESIQDMQAKLYAGLDAETVKSLEGIKFAAIAEQRLQYKMANFVFLPDEIDDIDGLCKAIAVVFAADVVYLATMSAYEAFFNIITEIKKRCQIKNSAAAFLKIIEFAWIGFKQWQKTQEPQGGGPSGELG